MIRFPTLLVLPAAAAVLLLSAACGDDKPSGSPFGGAGRSDIGSASSSKEDANELAKQLEKVAKDAQVAQEKSGGGSPLTPGKASAPKNPVAAVKPSKTQAGGCEVKVSGDLSLSFKSPTGSGSVGSEYWFGKDELRGAFKEIAKVLDPKAASEIEKAAKETANDPWMLLLLNCDSEEGGISLFPAASSGYADVPFGPKTYRIASGGILGGGAKPGEFAALITIRDDLFGLDEPGELKITKFDKTGITGSFSLKGTQQFAFGAPAKKITIAGTFDYPCDGGQNCKR